jgi:predicted enzyme related to lactoylglutathione lyase
MAKVLGVGGVFFKSPNPQKLCQWYSLWLGIPIDLQSGMTFAVFQPSSMPPAGYTVWSAFEATSTYFAPSEQTFMFNLIVDDLKEALNQVKDGGGQVIGKIEESEYGQFGWFTDPDGNKVELWQPPEPKP